MLKQLRVARVRAVEPQNIDIFFCQVDPAWLLGEWNRESATCREFRFRAFRCQGFPWAVGEIRRWFLSSLLCGSGEQQQAAGGRQQQQAAGGSGGGWQVR